MASHYHGNRHRRRHAERRTIPLAALRTHADPMKREDARSRDYNRAIWRTLPRHDTLQSGAPLMCTARWNDSGTRSLGLVASCRGPVGNPEDIWYTHAHKASAQMGLVLICLGLWGLETRGHDIESMESDLPCSQGIGFSAGKPLSQSYIIHGIQ